MQATIFDIQRASMVDGPGLRTTVFFKGCNLRCAWCHNPEGMQQQRQLMFYESRCTLCGQCRKICTRRKCIACGECAQVCLAGARKMVGRCVMTDELLSTVLEDQPFYGAEGGVTCSGGECMLQVEFLSDFLRQCRDSNLHTAVDTAGCVPWTSFERILPYTKLFLFDVKCISAELHERFVGVNNRLILDNYSHLLEAGARVWVRVPLIPGFNCEDGEMELLRTFFAKQTPEKIEVLPYHAMGEGKYKALSKECAAFTVPSEEQIQKYSHWLDTASM